MGKKIIKIALIIFIVSAPVSGAAAAAFESSAYYSSQIKVFETNVAASYTAASISTQAYAKTTGTSSDSIVAIVIIMMIPFALIIDAIIKKRQSKLRSAAQKHKRILQKPVANAPQTPESFSLSTIIKQLELYDLKIDDDKMSAEIKKMVCKISDIDTAAGENKIWAKNIEDKLKKLFADFFRYLDTYADFDTLSDQTNAIRDTKQKIMEAAGLLYNALDRTYNTLIDEITDGISADAEALKNILAVKGLLKETPDMHSQNESETAGQPDDDIILAAAANNTAQNPVQDSVMESDALPFTEILKTINTYYMKSLSPELSEILKNIFIRVADIAKASGSDTEKLKDIEKDFGKIFPEFFKLVKNYFHLGTLHDQTENICKIKVSIIEIARLLAGGLDQIYNDIISRTSIDISADIEAFKGRMSINGFGSDEFDLYKLISNNRLK